MSSEARYLSIWFESFFIPTNTVAESGYLLLLFIRVTGLLSKKRLKFCSELRKGYIPIDSYKYTDAVVSGEGPCNDSNVAVTLGTSRRLRFPYRPNWRRRSTVSSRLRQNLTPFNPTHILWVQKLFSITKIIHELNRKFSFLQHDYLYSIN